MLAENDAGVAVDDIQMQHDFDDLPLSAQIAMRLLEVGDLAGLHGQKRLLTGLHVSRVRDILQRATLQFTPLRPQQLRQRRVETCPMTMEVHDRHRKLAAREQQLHLLVGEAQVAQFTGKPLALILAIDQASQKAGQCLDQCTIAGAEICRAR